MIEKILITTEGKAELCDCYAFGNADGKQWVMPRRNMRMAMNLYQPSSRKGRLMKQLFPIRLLQALISRRLTAKRERVRLNDELLDVFHTLWGDAPIDFSLFGGTPGRHRKTIIQLSRGNEILGYCKVTENPEIAALFDGETVTLRHLHAQGLCCVPKALYRGRTASGLEIFVQSTVKTRKSRVCHRWTPMHDAFLQEMEERTATEMAFEETDYYQTLLQLRDNIALYPFDEYRDRIASKVEEVIAEYAGKRVRCSAYHGDFTPWNTFADGDQLYVFDWEYGKRSYPPKMDECHFLIQTAIFEKHMDAEGIAAEVAGMPKKLVEMYLLDVISRFTIREQGNPTEEVRKTIKTWSLFFIC